MYDIYEATCFISFQIIVRIVRYQEKNNQDVNALIPTMWSMLRFFRLLFS